MLADKRGYEVGEQLGIFFFWEITQENKCNVQIFLAHLSKPVFWNFFDKLFEYFFFKLF